MNTTKSNPASVAAISGKMSSGASVKTFEPGARRARTCCATPSSPCRGLPSAIKRTRGSVADNLACDSIGTGPFHHQRHLAQSMCGAREAGVETTNGRLQPVEIAFRKAAAGCGLQEMPRGLFHREIHSLFILRGRDQQIGSDHQAVVIDPIMVEQRAPGGLAGSNALTMVELCFRLDVL